jgi:hypothetical protein
MSISLRIRVGISVLALMGASVVAAGETAGAATTDSSAAILPPSVPAGCTTAVYTFGTAGSHSSAYRETAGCGVVSATVGNYYIGRSTSDSDYMGQYYDGSNWIDGSRGYVYTQPTYGFLILLSTVLATTGVRTVSAAGHDTATSAY